MINYELSLDECCDDPTHCFYFGMFINLNQTEKELLDGETIEDNGVGWNKPDSNLTPLFSLLYDDYLSNGKIEITLDMRKAHDFRIKKVLKKYKKQYKRYKKLQPFQITETEKDIKPT